MSEIISPRETRRRAKRSMGEADFGLEADRIFRDARRRVALVFWINIVLACTIALVLVSAISAGIVFGFLGHDVWSTALGGVALLDLIGAAVYRPLSQVNNALIRSEQIDIVMLSARQCLREINESSAPGNLAAQQAWVSVLAELKALENISRETNSARTSPRRHAKKIKRAD